MADALAALRLTDELLWVLRRAGFPVATSQAIDVVRAVRAVGFASRAAVGDAVAAVIVKRARDRQRFDAVFDGFFAREPRRTLWERLAAEGFEEAELEVLRELLSAAASSRGDGAATALVALVHGGAELDRLLQLAGATQALLGMQSPLQAGFFTHRLLEQVGAWRAEEQLSGLRVRLVDALGEARGGALAAALGRELRRATDDVRAFVRSTQAARDAEASAQDDSLLGAPFASLDEAEVAEVRRAVRAFVQRLRGGARVRRRRATRGRLDVHATLRRSMRTGGVPFAVARRARRREKPRLLFFCDISDSVKSVARFLLELTFASQELFEQTRTFVFVSDLGETTRLFAEQPIEVALARAYGGEIVPVTHNSNYGRVLRAVEQDLLPAIDRRTTVVILGDGRTNYQEDAAGVLDRVRARARALVWLCPEPRGAWATGDSAMPRYAPKCTRVLEVRCARDLETAARLLLALR
jgi:uncharacterized protein with von Willebrand factor type A (vWA) domain